MARVALTMALHDRQKTIGAVVGIAFAYLLIGQNICTTAHYLDQATSFIDNAGADLWIVAPATRAFSVASSPISTAAIHQARVCEGVTWAEPIVSGATWVKLPDGGAQRVILVGASSPSLRGGPYNIVRGEKSALLKPNAIFVEDSDREKLGGVNIGSMIELNRQRAHVEGFTWGLVTLFGSYAFAEFDFARSILEMDSDRISCVIVGIDDPAQLTRVRQQLQERVPEAVVLTTADFRALTHQFILFDAGIIGVLAMGIFIGLTVGLAIVILAMLSSVQQNIREFGTLKAIGVTNADLRRLIFIQAGAYSIFGSFIGASLLCQLAWTARSPRLLMVVHPLVLIGLVPVVAGIALFAASLSIRRVQRLEPGSVFR